VTKRILPYAIGGEADDVEFSESLLRQGLPTIKRIEKRVISSQQAQVASFSPDLSGLSFNPTKDWYEKEEITEYVLGEMGVAGSNLVLQFYHHKDMPPQEAVASIWARAVEDLGALSERS
jgi:hypothetical protein